jgi:hypothetical protein
MSERTNWSDLHDPRNERARSRRRVPTGGGSGGPLVGVAGRGEVAGLLERSQDLTDPVVLDQAWPTCGCACGHVPRGRLSTPIL